MDPLVMNTLKLEQYQCRKCGRFFYINKMDKGSLDLDFGCPYGCDDNGGHVRDLLAKVEEVTEMAHKKERGVIEKVEETKIDDHKITITLCEGDCEQSMGREPKDREEFDKWAGLAEKGLLNGHIDWDIIYECTKDAMPCDGAGDENESTEFISILAP